MVAAWSLADGLQASLSTAASRSPDPFAECQPVVHRPTHGPQRPRVPSRPSWQQPGCTRLGTRVPPRRGMVAVKELPDPPEVAQMSSADHGKVRSWQELRLIGPDGLTVSLACSLTYSRQEPYAVRLSVD